MKVKNFVLIATLLFMINPSNAMLTDELTSPEYIVNSGYSTVMAEHVQLTKAQNSNQEYKRVIKGKHSIWRKIRSYIEVGYDDGTILQHDINPSQSIWDW